MITVRHATMDDFESIAAAYVAGWRHGFREMFPAAFFQQDGFDDERRAECMADLTDDRTTTSVAEIDGSVVGFSGVQPGDAPCVGDLWVHPHAWGSGAAAALLSAIEEEQRTIGTRRLVAWVPEDSPRARRLFEKLGWRHTGKVEQFRAHPDDTNRLFEYDRTII